MSERHHRWYRLALAAAVFAPLIGPTTVANATPSSLDWTEIAHAHPAGQDSYFVDSWSDGTDVWAAGYRRSVVGGAIEWRTWVQRCSGSAGTCALQNTHDVESAPSTTYLEGISGTSASDIWVVGRAKQPFVGWESPLTEHFDGSTWVIVPTPVNVGALYSVSAHATDDVWAVGDDKRVISQSKPLALHWDGSAWHEDSMSIPGCDQLQLWDVDATGNRPLAVGVCHQRRGDQAIIISRASDGWRAEPVEGANLKKVDLKSINWTGGTAWAGGVEHANHNVTLRRQDGAWTSVPSVPHAGTTYGFAGTRSNDVWAVGSYKLGFTTMHWDGTAWTSVRDPGTGWLESVSRTSDGTPWAVGHTYGRLSEIQRYDGDLGSRP